MAKQLLALLLSFLILFASQHCVEERIHLHTEVLGRSTVTYHHHHDDHGVANHSNSTSPEHETECGESTCFQRASSAVTKIEIPQLDPRMVILGLHFSEEMPPFDSSSPSEIRREWGVSPPDQSVLRILLANASAPNAPPRLLL